MISWSSSFTSVGHPGGTEAGLLDVFGRLPGGTTDATFRSERATQPPAPSGAPTVRQDGRLR